ncbi:MAG TPA: YciI family protein [Solirubrobacteraceae bacterium]|nr:YciI family protein [Solirubrobacteraceae bacterium]
MPDYQLVELARGPEWDESRPRREQAGWDEHAAVMDQLVERGVVVLGGPVGDGDGDYVLLVVAADDEADVRRHLAADPWLDSILTIASVRPWTLWLQGDMSDDWDRCAHCGERLGMPPSGRFDEDGERAEGRVLHPQCLEPHRDARWAAEPPARVHLYREGKDGPRAG